MKRYNVTIHVMIEKEKPVSKQGIQVTYGIGGSLDGNKPNEFCYTMTIHPDSTNPQEYIIYPRDKKSKPVKYAINGALGIPQKAPYVIENIEEVEPAVKEPAPARQTFDLTGGYETTIKCAEKRLKTDEVVFYPRFIIPDDPRLAQAFRESLELLDELEPQAKDILLAGFSATFVTCTFKPGKQLSVDTNSSPIFQISELGGSLAYELLSEEEKADEEDTVKMDISGEWQERNGVFIRVKLDAPPFCIEYYAGNEIILADEDGQPKGSIKIISGVEFPEMIDFESLNYILSKRLRDKPRYDGLRDLVDPYVRLEFCKDDEESYETDIDICEN